MKSTKTESRKQDQRVSHTPGPWSFAKTDTGCRIITPGIADVLGREDGIDNETRNLEANANARLIAAAPELLEACKAADNWLLPYPETPDSPHTNSLRALMDQLRAAIAKATGQ